MSFSRLESLSTHEDAGFCTNNVTVKDSKGRFMQALRDKERRAAEELAKEGATLAAAFAPKRTGRMAGSLLDPSNHTAGSQGFSWKVVAPYWEVQERGGRPHPITGMVRFFWEKEGRPWVPGFNQISHPGNPATHFMLRSYEVLRPKILATLEYA